MSASTPRLSLYTGVAIVVGSIIGSGLFIKPATMAQQLGSPLLLLLIWILAGAMSLLGALIFAAYRFRFVERWVVRSRSSFVRGSNCFFVRMVCLCYYQHRLCGGYCLRMRIVHGAIRDAPAAK